MGLDIRVPLGMLFLAIGLLMVVYGAITWGSPIYAAASGMNINLIWGAVMALFGAVMLFFGRRVKP